MGYWNRELRLYYESKKDKPILRDSWGFAVYINLCVGITDLLRGNEPTFRGFLVGLLIGFPVMVLLELGFRKWGRRISERADTPPPAAGSTTVARRT
jgi:hypothetical protein